jgi:hypothetical protein
MGELPRSGMRYIINITFPNTPSRILYSFQEPTLPVYMQRMWQLNSSQVGLVFIGAALPAMLGQSHAFGRHVRQSTTQNFAKHPP